MAILNNRVKNINNFNNYFKLLSLPLRKLLNIFFIIISLCLFSLPLPNKVSSIFLENTGFVIDYGFSFMELIIEKIGSINLNLLNLRKLELENINLKFEIARLKDIRFKNDQLIDENSYLKKLVKINEFEQDHFVPVKLLNYTLSSINKTALIQGGLKAGIKVDQVAKNENGLIGRVIEVSENYAKILLVNDQLSRIPVILSESKERGILVGNGVDATIIYLPDDSKTIVGEKVLTSGDGKIYPHSIEIGKLSEVKNGIVKVDLYANLRKSEHVLINIGNRE